MRPVSVVPFAAVASFSWAPWFCGSVYVGGSSACSSDDYDYIIILYILYYYGFLSLLGWCILNEQRWE